MSAARCRLEVDLGAIRDNARRLAAVAAPAELWAVVKADGYGHGAVDAGRAAVAGGARRLCVATLEEGQALRSAVDDVPAPERQENTRVGLTVSLPVTRSNALRLAWSRGAITRAGSNFTTWTVGWQTTRIRRPARPTVGGG